VTVQLVDHLASLTIISLCDLSCFFCVDLDSIEVLSPEIQRRQSQPLTVPQHQRE